MRPSVPRLPLIRSEPKRRPEKCPGRADESKPQAQKQHRILPWRSVEFSKFGRGAESCLLSLVLCGTSQRPVRRLLPATSVSLQGSSRRCSSGLPKHGRTDLPPTLTAPSPNARRDDRHTVRRHHPRRPPCVPHRHARRALSGFKRRGSGPKPRASPRVAGGRPFSANPEDGDLRRFSTTGAGPTSPARLPVYPRAERGDYGHGFAGGESGWG